MVKLFIKADSKYIVQDERVCDIGGTNECTVLMTVHVRVHKSRVQ